jgi:hypothetical protein
LQSNGESHAEAFVHCRAGFGRNHCDDSESPASAAAFGMNNVGTGARVGAATGGWQFTGTSMQIPREGPKQRRYVCGPIVNYDGTPHCHWVD